MSNMTVHLRNSLETMASELAKYKGYLREAEDEIERLEMALRDDERLYQQGVLFTPSDDWQDVHARRAELLNRPHRYQL